MVSTKKRLKARDRRMQKIARHLERIIQFAQFQRRVPTTAEIEKLLRVGNATARRYFGRLKTTISPRPSLTTKRGGGDS